MERHASLHSVQYPDLAAITMFTISLMLFQWLRRAFFFIVIPAFLVYACSLVYVLERMDGSATFPVDCGIVFGAAVWPVYNRAGDITTTTAGPGIERRVSAGARLYHQGNVKRLFLTGGKGDGHQRSEAEVMREYALELGVPADRIIVEGESRSTWENLLFTRPLTNGCNSIVAISDSYHLARISLQAQIQGWKLYTYPAETPPSRLFTLRSLLREAAGIDALVLDRLSR